MANCNKVSLGVVVAFALILLPAAVQGQAFAPAPAPTSDGTSIDQGIAYVLYVAGSGAHIHYPQCGYSCALLMPLNLVKERLMGSGS